MIQVRTLLAGFLLFSLLGSSVLIGQDEGKKEKGKQDSPNTKARGILPTYWREIGLSDNQKQEVYKIQNKYNAEIEKLEIQIKELKSKMAEERLKVLTDEQKKNLEKIIKAKAGTLDN